MKLSVCSSMIQGGGKRRAAGSMEEVGGLAPKRSFAPLGQAAYF
jgi:hypothetical protein